jgi:hypothetical protein
MLRRPSSEEPLPPPIVGPAFEWPGISERAVRSHRQLAATLNIAAGVLYLLFTAGTLLFFVLVGGVVTASGEPGVGGFLGILGLLIAIFLAILSLPSILAGWALYVEKSWAKPLLLIISALHLMNFPLGTALGVYTMWVVLSTDPVSRT